MRFLASGVLRSIAAALRSQTKQAIKKQPCVFLALKVKKFLFSGLTLLQIRHLRLPVFFSSAFLRLTGEFWYFILTLSLSLALQHSLHLCW
tara:strand:+ start:321 stop:593 length:273 start_codon:yes stop_codon:yes gene_type:complete